MKSINDIIGQENILEHMQQSVKTKKISHAYLFDGEAGSGKKMLAHLFARAIFCEGKHQKPCDNCPSCLSYLHHNHPDIIEIDKEPDKTKILIDQIRYKVINDLKIKPYTYDYKIYMIHQAHLMSEQAENALLKSLEEPPEYAVIFLLSENMESFLPTIRSRCVTFKMTPVKEELIERLLMKNIEVPDYQARLCARFSRGNVGKAIQIARDPLFNEMREMVIKFAHLFIQGNLVDQMKMNDQIKENKQFKEQAHVFFDLLLSWMRDMLCVKAIDDKRQLIHEDKYSILKKQAENMDFNRISQFIDQIEKVKAYIDHNVNITLSLDTLFIYE